MPLHLLSKKSWNIYNPAAQERIAKDETAAAAREAENDRRMQEYDSERRLAILRGEEAPPPPPEPESERPAKRVRENGSGASDSRKRRRLQGEDDTDRDLRLAREDMDRAQSARNTLGGPAQSGPQKERKRIDAPITDRNGHINLFPVDSRVDSRAHKNAEVEAEKKRKERELEDQYTMRFSNAAGKDGLSSSAWYASADRSSRLDSSAAYRGTKTVDPKKSEVERRLEDEKIEAELYGLGKNAWGRPDPARHQRDAARVSSNDPLAFMKRAQTQLTKAKVDRESWEQQRAGGFIREKEKEDRRRRREKDRRREERSDRHARSRRHDSEDSLDGFSLDAPVEREQDRSKKHRSSSQDRHRSSRSDRDRSSRHHRGDEERSQRRRHDEERR